MLPLILLLACGARPDEPPPASPATGPTAPTHPSKPPSGSRTGVGDLTLVSTVTLTGLCEPSAAIAGPNGLWIAEDDGLDYLLTAPHTPRDGDAPQRVPLTLGSEALALDDLEAGARIGDEVWWTTSVSRSRPGRTLMAWSEGVGGTLAGTVELLPWREPGAFERLVRAHQPSCDLPDDLHQRKPKKGGLDIEGLAATEEQLLLGLRGPLSVEGQRAVVVGLDRAGAKAGRPATGLVTEAWCLDLQGQGIRSLTADPGAPGTFLGIAGDVGSGGDFHLFSWQPGQPPVRVGRIPTPADTSPEGLVVGVDGSQRVIQVLFDEGTRTESQTGCPCAEQLAGRCEGHPAREASARLATLKWPAP